MNKIEQLSDVWDNGDFTPATLGVIETRAFKHRTGAKQVVAVRWSYCGQEYEITPQVALLLDHTGLVHCDNGLAAGKKLIVLNGDNTQRVVIDVPSVDENSKPEEGYLALPPSSACFGGIEWGCEGNDGYTDYLFDFDWQTGVLLRYARPTRPW